MFKSVFSTCVLATAVSAGLNSDSKIANDASALSTTSAVALDKVMLNDLSAEFGAACLDGSPYGYYFVKAANATHANDWQIYFEGGGWCYDELDCINRSHTDLGSSTKWPAQVDAGGIMSSDCNVNPDFCQFNRVFLKYCDGNSFSGNRDDVVVYNNAKLWFRGRRNLDVVMRDLYNSHNFANADNVMLTGCSAGGLSTYLHTDYVHSWLPPTVTKYKSFPISGFFLLHENAEFKTVYPDQMKYIFNLANSTHGVNDDCIKDKSPDQQWRCNFAPETYKYIKAPIFPLNSNYDSWQMACILTSEPNPAGSGDNGHCNSIPGAWNTCLNSFPEQCTTDIMPQLNEFGSSFLDAYSSALTSSKSGNGAFFHSCYTHCEGQDNGFYQRTNVNGVTMQQAVTAFWNSNDEPAEKHTYSSCIYNANSSPRQCNPTC